MKALYGLLLVMGILLINVDVSDAQCWPGSCTVSYVQPVSLSPGQSSVSGTFFVLLSIANPCIGTQTYLNISISPEGHVFGAGSVGPLYLSVGQTSYPDCPFTVYQPGQHTITAYISYMQNGREVKSAPSSYNFTVTVPLAASVSGPAILAVNQVGTYTCYASGGVPPYSYQWWKEENGVPAFGPVASASILPNRPAPGNWYQVGANSQTLQSSDVTNFSLKCVVSDAAGGGVTSNIASVSVGASQSAKANGVGTGTVLGTAVPEKNSLSQNYPNPFNPTTQIRFGLSKPSHVALAVYDMLGREVATLADEQMDAGYHSVTWNATGFPSGVYIYRLTTDKFSVTRRMLVLK